MHAKYFKKITANSDNDALFRETVDQRKCVIPLFQQRLLPGVLAIANFRNITNFSVRRAKV